MFIALVTIVVMLWFYHQNMFLFIWKIDFYLFTNFLKLSNQLKKEIAIDTLVRTKNIFETINKSRNVKEYCPRMRKIWSSDHKLKAHNAFANPFVTLTVGILDRTGQKINNIDIKKRKILSNNGSFHPNGDVDRFYLHRKKNRKRIKLVELLLEGSTCFTVRQEIKWWNI